MLGVLSIYGCLQCVQRLLTFAGPFPRFAFLASFLIDSQRAWISQVLWIAEAFLELIKGFIAPLAHSVSALGAEQCADCSLPVFCAAINSACSRAISSAAWIAACAFDCFLAFLLNVPVSLNAHAARLLVIAGSNGKWASAIDTECGNLKLHSYSVVIALFPP